MELTTQRWELTGGFGIENLRWVEASLPPPAADEVVIELEAMSLNYRDLLMVEGRYNPRQPLPLVPGSDGAGRIVAAGRDVTTPRIGDRVVPLFAQHWLQGDPSAEVYASTLGGPLDGTFARHVRLKASGVVVVPERYEVLSLATLPCAGVTAWNALFGLGDLQRGQDLLVLGTGGVALFALQFAVRRGARVLITSSDDAKLERAMSLGATAGLNYREVSEWGRSVRQLTGGRGVDQVVELGGAQTLAQSLAAVRPGGTVSLIGNLGGNEARLSVIPILMRQIRVQGVMVGSRRTLEAMVEDLSDPGLGPVTPVLDRTFPLTELPQALRYLQSGRHFGKICLEA